MTLLPACRREKGGANQSPTSAVGDFCFIIESKTFITSFLSSPTFSSFTWWWWVRVKEENEDEPHTTEFLDGYKRTLKAGWEYQNPFPLVCVCPGDLLDNV